MDCGIPFCHGPTGCPVHNQIPDWNDLVFSDDWEEAARNLHSTNNFPEFTGRVCPAPCEEACTLNLENQPVTIKTIEQAIADKAWEMGWVKPEPAETLTGKRVAVIGSGPGRHGRRPAARPRRPRGARVRARGEARRASALRHSRLQDGEAPHRPAREADGGRRRRLPLRRQCRRDQVLRLPAQRVRRGSVRGRRRGSARSEAAGPGPQGRAFRDALPDAVEQARRRRGGRRTSRSWPPASMWS